MYVWFVSCFSWNIFRRTPVSSVSLSFEDRQGRSDRQQATYTKLHNINRVHVVWEGGERAQRWDGAEEEDEEKAGWRQERGVRKPQITTINHQAVNIFTC